MVIGVARLFVREFIGPQIDRLFVSSVVPVSLKTASLAMAHHCFAAKAALFMPQGIFSRNGRFHAPFQE
jgi:hypothetical protein